MSDQELAVQLHNEGSSFSLISLTPARHNADGGSRPDLTWDDGLAASAQAWADTMARTGQFEHSRSGENLFAASPAATLADGVTAWVNELSSYHGEVIPNGNFESYGHYTQVRSRLVRSNIRLSGQAPPKLVWVSHLATAGCMWLLTMTPLAM